MTKRQEEQRDKESGGIFGVSLGAHAEAVEQLDSVKDYHGCSNLSRMALKIAHHVALLCLRSDSERFGHNVLR